MRCLNRNKTAFYYALYQGQAPTLDEDGFESGEMDVSYSEPKPCSGNISPAQGSAYARLFGTDIAYDRVIVVEDRDIEIDEHSVLWIDNLPPVPGSYDYIVKRVARSLNHTTIAVKKVNVDG